MSTDVTQALNKQVANWMVLYIKLHHYHWFIKGRHFFTLHEKFEELYEEASQNIDELAERILSIGGSPVSTMKDSLQLASISEAEGNIEEEGMVKSVISDFEKMSGELEDGIKTAEDAGDDGTADMFIGIKQSLSKHIWMLKAFLG